MFICAVVIVFAAVESKPLSPDRVSGMAMGWKRWQKGIETSNCSIVVCMMTYMYNYALPIEVVRDCAAI